MKIYSCTDRGKIREINEDSVYASESDQLYIVADGMGGYFGGEIASQLAVETLSACIKNCEEVDRTILLEGFTLANRTIFETAQNKEQKLMGTTTSLLYIESSCNSGWIGHIGDSRIYRVRATSLEQLTKDHSYVEELIDAGKITREEAFSHPNRNIITRALGTHPQAEADLIQFPVQMNDLFLLCSDGLSNKLPFKDLEDILISEDSLEDKGKELLKEALLRGGEDNISLVLVEIGETGVKA
jgi:protein phosphatase